MKQLSKDLKVKGKNLFHPVRLALTGEMSGQDVTKQLSLLSMAHDESFGVDKEQSGVVSFEARMEKLKAFCETIPAEFQVPKTDEKQKDAPKESNDAVNVAAEPVTTVAPVQVDPIDTYEGPPITALDIRVGRIVKAWEHPDADKLFCELVDIGEDEPRQIASGLKPYMNVEDLEGRMVLVLANLKARNLAGFPSHGMVLCASNEDHTEVKFVSPPVDAKIGERVTVPDFDFEGEEGAPFAENKVGKKKVFENLAPFLVTNKYGVPEFLGRPFVTSAGVCTSPIAGGNVA
jgi:methionine--tRNA ligase beta chain